MKKRVFTYSIIAALALTLMVPVIALSQMGPRRQGPAWAPQPSGAQGFARGRGRADGAGARGGRGFGREFGRRGRGGSFSGARFGDNARSSLAARALARTDALGLSTDQEQQVRETQRAYQDASIERRAVMQVAQLDMRELMRAEAKDLGAIEAKLRELSDVEIAVQISRLYLDQAVGEVLTEEQLDELDDPPDRRRGRGGRGGRGAERRGRREAAR